MEGLLGNPAPGTLELGSNVFDPKTHTFSELFHNCVYMGTVIIFLYFARLNSVFLAKRKRLIGESESFFWACVGPTPHPIHPRPSPVVRSPKSAVERFVRMAAAGAASGVGVGCTS